MSMGGGGKSHTDKRLMGIDFQGAEYGNCVPVLFGRNKVAGNVIWYGDFKAIKHKEETGGKGGGGQTNTTFTYTASFQIGLIEGVGSVNKIYDGTAVKSLADYGAVQFTGTLTQAAWSHLSAPYNLTYSGTVHVDFQNLDLGGSASLPNLNFEMNGLNQFNAGGGIYDANPADIVTTVCTDPQLGIGFGSLGDMTAFSNYCKAAGIFFSPLYDQQQPASTVLEDLFKYANSAPFYSEGKLKVVPYCDQTLTGNGATFTPNTASQADLGPGDFITNGTDSAIKVKRANPTDAENIVRIEYRDAGLDYRTIPVQATIDQDMIANGVRAMDSESVDMITSGPVAKQVVQNLLQRRFYLRNNFEFQLPYRYCYLEPMDTVTLTEPSLGLSFLPVRILEIGEDEEGLLSVVAEEFPDGLSHGNVYAVEPPAGYKGDVNVNPGAIDAPYIFRGPGFLTTSPEIWCAIAADNDLWGGCDVYISHNGTTYNYLTSHNKESKYGYITNAITAGLDLDSVNVPNVVLNGSAKLLGGSADDRDNFTTISMIGTELVSYQTATLASGPSYNLASLRRGAYGTARASHAINAPFVRLDDTILQIPIDPSLLGKTIWMKFLSYNCFGLGGRTLGSETAYQYVVGSNVEFPDVPLTPSSFTMTPVADGVNLSWINTNPAAVACTSIEYATASGGPWSVLAQVGPTTTHFHHAFRNGLTFFYRARSRGHQISAGWSAYTTPGAATAIDAEAAAAAAQADATNALNQLVDISNDNLLTPGEKPSAIRDRDAITAEQAGIDAKATSFAIGAEKTTYDSAVTALTAYLATLTSPVLWSTLTGNTTIVGTTFRQKFLDVYSARQALLNKIYQTAKDIADGKITTYFQSTAPYTSGGTVGDLWTDTDTNVTARWDGSTWVPSSAYVATANGANLIANSTFSSNLMGFTSGAIGLTGKQMVDGWYCTIQADANNTLAYCSWSPGIIRCQVSGSVVVPASSNSNPQVRILTPFSVDPGAVYSCDFNAVYAYNGALNAGITASSRMLIRWLDTAGNQISIVAITRPRGAAAGWGGWTDFTAPSNAVTAVVFLDVYVANSNGTATTACTSTVALQANFVAVAMVKKSLVAIPGSGVQIGDTRNLLQLNVGNGTAKVPTVISYSASAGTPATATISVAAWTMLAGSVSVSYAAKTVGTTGTNNTTVNYFLYLDDPTFSGTGTLVATTNGNTIFQGDGRVYIGTVAVTYPLSGSGSGGGSSGGNQGSCVCIDMSLTEERIAAEARMDMMLDCMDYPTCGDKQFRRRIQRVGFADAACVRIHTDGGAVLALAAITPFDLLDGRVAVAQDMLGEMVYTDKGIETVVLVEDIGVQPVAHISVGGISYAAGLDPSHRIYSHNALKP